VNQPLSTQPSLDFPLPYFPDLFSQFAISGKLIAAHEHGSGLINQTFLITAQESDQTRRYIFQKLNTHVFQNTQGLMQNIIQVTEHIRNKLVASKSDDIERRVLSLIPLALDKNTFHLNHPAWGTWRVYHFLENTLSFDVLKTTEQAFLAAQTVGEFQALLADYDGPALVETIPNFHHTLQRLENFKIAVRNDTQGRASQVSKEIDFVLERSSLAGSLLGLYESGKIPLRITHNDTKLNNVMIDRDTGVGLCMIDLDTVMPGLSLYDFGDMVRTACNPGAEDATDITNLCARKDVFQALARGYLQGTAGALLPIEIENLAKAGQLLTFECGMRFLTDYLEGDHYFKIQHPQHNLDRARNQFALVKSLEDQEQEFITSI
jgi:thiamine kinase-like enzyme